MLADGLDRAFLEGSLAGALLVGRVWLLPHEAVALVVTPGDVPRGRLPAEVAVDAGGVDEIRPGRVLGKPLREVSHVRSLQGTGCEGRRPEADAESRETGP